mmetsp:Transcript_19415/g.45895  ORF Transcript_19415/g.45895 Transcript_19415/m.45895 type:complete len:490 (+) Transcript_19415:469-1938(+)
MEAVEGGPVRDGTGQVVLVQRKVAQILALAEAEGDAALQDVLAGVEVHQRRELSDLGGDGAGEAVGLEVQGLQPVHVVDGIGDGALDLVVGQVEDDQSLPELGDFGRQDASEAHLAEVDLGDLALLVAPDKFEVALVDAGGEELGGHDAALAISTRGEWRLPQAHGGILWVFVGLLLGRLLGFLGSLLGLLVVHHYLDVFNFFLFLHYGNHLFVLNIQSHLTTAAFLLATIRQGKDDGRQSIPLEELVGVDQRQAGPGGRRGRVGGEAEGIGVDQPLERLALGGPLRRYGVRTAQRGGDVEVGPGLVPRCGDGGKGGCGRGPGRRADRRRARFDGGAVRRADRRLQGEVSGSIGSGLLGIAAGGTVAKVNDASADARPDGDGGRHDDAQHGQDDLGPLAAASASAGSVLGDRLLLALGRFVLLLVLINEVGVGVIAVRGTVGRLAGAGLIRHAHSGPSLLDVLEAVGPVGNLGGGVPLRHLLGRHSSCS